MQKQLQMGRPTVLVPNNVLDREIPREFIFQQMCYLKVTDRCSINQSIHLIFIAPTSQAKLCSVARQPNQCLIAKLMKQFHGINGLSGGLVTFVNHFTLSDIRTRI